MLEEKGIGIDQTDVTKQVSSETENESGGEYLDTSEATRQDAGLLVCT